MNYIKMLVEDFHSTIIATIGSDGHPQTRVIDMMDYDDKGIYFLTAKGKTFYKQLMQQQYISLSASKNKMAISLRGFTKDIGRSKLDSIFEKNEYMKEIYPSDTRDILEVFCLYEARGEFFDISDPSKIVRETITIGEPLLKDSSYCIEGECNGCGLCYLGCPTKCIDNSMIPYKIDYAHCLNCGRCKEVCPKGAVKEKYV